MNKASTFTTMGARNFAIEEREMNDFYAIPHEAVEWLLELEKFKNKIWEPACGQGHISKVLIKHGFNVYSTDLIDRGYGIGGVDFLKCETKTDRDIITNPPFSLAQEFVEKALELVPKGGKVAMFLKIQFLETKSRRELFKKYNPKYVYVSSSRLACAKGGDFENSKSKNAMCFCWYIWEKGYKGDTILRWFN